MKITLNIRPSANAERRPVAWWLAGGTATDWLAEIGQWPIDQDHLSFVVIHGANKACAGVLVIVADDDSDVVKQSWPGGVGYGRIGNRLFVPADAVLEPAASEDELKSLLPDDEALYVWHPSLGLLHVDPSTVCRIEDLVVTPPQAMPPWNAGVSGMKLNQRLQSVTPEFTIDIKTMMQAAGEDIGSQSQFAFELPRSPAELRMGRRILLGVAIVLLSLLGFILINLIYLRDSPHLLREMLIIIGMFAVAFPTAMLVRRYLNSLNDQRSTGGGSWWKNMGQWVAARMNELDEQLNALRNREVERLLHMLQVNPDEGLRYAMPMVDQPNHRGVTSRGARLLERIVDFSLSRCLGGGSPDLWSIKADYQHQLVRRYRELADREIMLGRHRRAAYIYAELLHDLRTAATTLADGGFYREAAALYEQKLHDPVAAARCLENGGLLAEAIVLYQRQGNYVKVGELHEKLEQLELASQAFERAANQKLEQQDYIGSAQLFESKLRHPERALAILLSGWPDSHQAVRCLDESFALLGRQADHERTARHVESLCQEFGGTFHHRKLLRSLSEVTKKYPDVSVRQLAEDRTLVLTARLLDDSAPSIKNQLIKDIANLIPHDRLFARDCGRFAPLYVPKNETRTKRSDALRIVHEFRLTGEDWRSVIAIGDEFYAAGFRGTEMLLVRGSWDGTMQQPGGQPWKVPARCSESPVMLVAHGASKILVHVFNAPTFSTDREFPKTDWFGYRAAGGHPAFDTVVAGMCVNGLGNLATIRIAGEGAVFNIHRLIGGQLLHTQNAGHSIFANDSVFPLVIAQFDQTWVVSAGTRFNALDGSKSHSLLLPSRIRLLESFRSSYLALLEIGAYLWFSNPLQATGTAFAADLENPVGCFLSHDTFLLADASQIQLYRHRGAWLALEASHEGLQSAPIGCIAIRDRQQAALFLRDGRVVILGTS